MVLRLGARGKGILVGVLLRRESGGAAMQVAEKLKEGVVCHYFL